MKCGEELLAAGRKQGRPLKFIVDTIVAGCPKTKFSGIGTLPREVATFINGECAKCNKNPICIGYLAQHTGHDTLEQKKLVEEKLTKCLSCKDLDNCIHYFMTQLGISKFSLIKGAFLVKFRRCSSQNMMRISLDLPPGTEGNVIGTLKRDGNPKTGTGTETE
jgi:hypothetical protein